MSRRWPRLVNFNVWDLICRCAYNLPRLTGKGVVNSVKNEFKPFSKTNSLGLVHQLAAAYQKLLSVINQKFATVNCY